MQISYPGRISQHLGFNIRVFGAGGNNIIVQIKHDKKILFRDEERRGGGHSPQVAIPALKRLIEKSEITTKDVTALTLSFEVSVTKDDLKTPDYASFDIEVVLDHPKQTYSNE